VLGEAIVAGVISVAGGMLQFMKPDNDTTTEFKLNATELNYSVAFCILLT